MGSKRRAPEQTLRVLSGYQKWCNWFLGHTVITLTRKKFYIVLRSNINNKPVNHNKSWMESSLLGTTIKGWASGKDLLLIANTETTSSDAMAQGHEDEGYKINAALIELQWISKNLKQNFPSSYGFQVGEIKYMYKMVLSVSNPFWPFYIQLLIIITMIIMLIPKTGMGVNFLSIFIKLSKNENYYWNIIYSFSFHSLLLFLYHRSIQFSSCLG